MDNGESISIESYSLEACGKRKGNARKDFIYEIDLVGFLIQAKLKLGVRLVEEFSPLAVQPRVSGAF